MGRDVSYERRSSCFLEIKIRCPFTPWHLPHKTCSGGILKARGEPGSFIKDTDLIKPEGLKLWHQLAHQEQNLFKHADRDPDGERLLRLWRASDPTCS